MMFKDHKKVTTAKMRHSIRGQLATALLDVTVDNSGRVKKIGVIRDVPSLTPEAIAAVRGWTIEPATLLSKAITSKLIVAFVFRPPNISKS
jgi:hypothetical protein